MLRYIYFSFSNGKLVRDYFRTRAGQYPTPKKHSASVDDGSETANQKEKIKEQRKTPDAPYRNSKQIKMPPKGKGNAAKGAAKGKAKKDEGTAGTEKVKGAQQINVRHILVSLLIPDRLEELKRVE